MSGAVPEPATGPALAPVGVPMGRIPSGSEMAPAYLVRSGGEFFALDPVEYAIFCRAQACLPRERLVTEIGKLWEGGGQRIPIAAGSMAERGLLIELSTGSGNGGNQLHSIRAIPRAITLGIASDPLGSFAILSADARRQLTLDAVDYALWSRFDGSTNLTTAVSEVSHDGGFSPGYLWEKTLGLLVAAMRGGVILLDR